MANSERESGREKTERSRREVGEGGEHRRDGSTEGIAGEVEVGEVPEAAEGCQDVASEGVPSEGEHREASGAAKGEGDDIGDGGRAEVEDGEGGREAGAEPVGEGVGFEAIVIKLALGGETVGITDIADATVELGCGALGRHGRLMAAEDERECWGRGAKRGLNLDANAERLFDEELAKEEKTDTEEAAASGCDRGIGRLGAVEQRALIKVGG